jgi:hypothetical protein
MDLFSRLRFAWRQRHENRAIRRYGYTVMYVGDYTNAPTWAYTIGFDETLGHPEIVVFDVPKASAAGLFARAFDDIRSGDLVIEDGLEWPREPGVRSAWRKVHPDHVGEWLTFACMRRALRTLEMFDLDAFQFVLSDAQGHLPWEPGYDERLRPLQPALWEAPVDDDGGACC